MPAASSNRKLAILLASVAALGGLLFGYDTAVISGAVGAIDHNFIAPRHLSETAANTLSGWTVSSALFGCILGSLVAGRCGDWLGRRNGMMVSAILFFISALGSSMPEIGFAPVGQVGPEALAPFICYRILGGVAIGLASTLCPLYIAEISPPQSRGWLVALQQMAIVTGIFITYFVNWGIASQGSHFWVITTGWRYMLASMTLPATLFFVLLFLVPDTPRWLVMKGRRDEARGVLARLGTPDVARTVEEIAISYEEQAENQARLNAFGWPVVVIGVLIGMFQQFVGINAVMYYAPLMFQNMGAAGNNAFLASILLGGVNFVSTVGVLFVIDRVGRKPLLLFGSCLMTVAMLALGIFFTLQYQGAAMILAILVYMFAFAVSWGPVAWVLMAEMFPNSIKGKAMPIAVASSWIANLFVSVTFKILDGDSILNRTFHHGFAYLLYAVISLGTVWFVIRFVPETKGLRLEAIEEIWRGEVSPQSSEVNAREAAGAI
ncbi:sugar porter family MFS transporter [Stakelama saccharophila]|uniref:Sugar porter family MFS transporter n=1 Tax=Stakelama saccharophila TaxID=3075605 RepID=A0ABZ0B5E8_9SPHN|nr:sugar porter family MFS transporter [Stakelama sp. W311]WNO52422.1 sugar porter family MFS transporter [Stakelama sp. W311]